MINIISLNKDLLAILFAFIVLGVFIYTTYTFLPIHKSSNTNMGVYNKLKLKLSIIKLKLSFVGTVSTLVNTSSNSTVVRVSDEDLNSLLEVVFAEIGDSKIIDVELLISLGLNTASVISHLQSLGFFILY